MMLTFYFVMVLFSAVAWTALLMNINHYGEEAIRKYEELNELTRFIMAIIVSILCLPIFFTLAGFISGMICILKKRF